MANVNAGYPQTVQTPANKNTIISAVEYDQTKHHMTTGTNSSQKSLKYFQTINWIQSTS
jgi:hypothetical protein